MVRTTSSDAVPRAGMAGAGGPGQCCPFLAACSTPLAVWCHSSAQHRSGLWLQPSLEWGSKAVSLLHISDCLSSYPAPGALSSSCWKTGFPHKFGHDVQGWWKIPPAAVAKLHSPETKGSLLHHGASRGDAFTIHSGSSRKFYLVLACSGATETCERGAACVASQSRWGVKLCASSIGVAIY